MGFNELKSGLVWLEANPYDKRKHKRNQTRAESKPAQKFGFILGEEKQHEG
jgi:hypothetical protein